MKVGFNLVSKTVGESFAKYKGDAVRLTLTSPATYDEVILELKNNKNLKRKITTFRNSDGEIIERAFDYFDKPYKNRLYFKTDGVIGEDKFVTSTTTKDYLLDKKNIGFYKDLVQYTHAKRTTLWTDCKTQTNHLAEDINTGEKVLSQVNIRSLKNNKKEHSFIEFPHIINSKVQKGIKKFLSYNVRTKNNSVIVSSLKKEGVKFPQGDSYLGYRALTIEDAKVPFAKKYIHERGLDDMNIDINPEYNPIHEKNPKFCAIFNADDGVINYNKDYKFPSKAALVSTAAHETEHGWQYYLQGRYTGGDTPWQAYIANKFGEIKEPDMLQEAKEYDYAIENYVPFWQDIEAYRKNKIEKLATQKGLEERTKYDAQGLSLRKSFPYIPNEFI